MVKFSFKSFVSGILIGCLVMIGSVGFASGVSKTIKVIMNAVSVKIDGKVLSGDRISYNNDVFISSKALAGYLGKERKVDKSGNVSLGNKVIAKKYGGIKGAITWQYNKVIGTKADTNAQIILFPTTLKKPDLSLFSLVLSATKKENELGIYTAKANGYGNYEIKNVPVGEYYILVVSNNTNSDMTIDDYDAERLKEIIRDEDYENLELKLKLNKYELNTIEVETNQITDFSYDFGNTYI